MNRLEQRVRKLEGRAGSKGLRAVIQGVSPPVSPDDSRLRAGVDDEGEALVSLWWSVWFFEGTREQQEERLKQLRADPRFQKPWDEDSIPLCIEGGACIDEVFCRLHEREVREKQKRNVGSLS